MASGGIARFPADITCQDLGGIGSRPFRRCTRRIRNAVRLVQDFKTLLKGLPETKFRFGICFSCRHYPITEPDYESRDGLMILVEDKNHADINRYVENSLSRLPSYREDYASLITSRAAGVFLWAVLVVKQVLDLKRNVKNHVTIMKEINKIPQDLDELYHNIIKDLRTPRTTLKLIQWICFVQEPLTANKLRWAIAIDPDGRYKTLRECRNSEDFIDDDDIDTGINVLSCGLAEVIQSGARTVQFIHQSVKDFFTERGLAILAGNSKPAGVVLIEANYMIIRSCTVYGNGRHYQSGRPGAGRTGRDKNAASAGKRVPEEPVGNPGMRDGMVGHGTKGETPNRERGPMGTFTMGKTPRTAKILRLALVRGPALGLMVPSYTICSHFVGTTCASYSRGGRYPC